MAKRASFAFFYPRLNVGGVQRALTLFANELSSRDYDVDFLVRDDSGKLVDALDAGVDLVVPRHGSRFRSVPSLVRYLYREQPDYLISRLESPNVSSVLACSVPGISTIPVPSEGAVREGLPADARVPIKATRKLGQLLFPRVGTFITNTHDLKHHVAELYGMQNSSVSVCPPPVLSGTEPHISPEPPHPFYETTDPVITSVARLAPVKRFDLLLRAVTQAQNDFEPRVVIAGPGEERESLLELAASLGIEDRVALPGYTDQPLTHMSHADLFALTSESESFGMTMVEALSCGTPIVATDVPYGPRVILDDGQYGILTGETPEAVADGLREAYRREWDHDRLRERAEDFRVDVVTDRLLDILGVSE